MDWLAKNPRYTHRYAMHVGALCREMTNKTVAELRYSGDRATLSVFNAAPHLDDESLITMV